jgi:hypothetical protein
MTAGAGFLRGVGGRRNATERANMKCPMGYFSDNDSTSEGSIHLVHKYFPMVLV